MERSGAPPILDFSVFYGDDQAAKDKLVADVKRCCLHNGFFQITGHSVPRALQQKAFQCSKRFFDLPLDEKNKVGKDTNTWGRGYEPLRFQMLEAGTSPDLKEGYIVAEDLPKDHHAFLQKKLNSGPNLWPESIDNLEEFKSTCTNYYRAVVSLAKDVLAVIALTLDLDPTFFNSLMDNTCSTVRFLHYPPQPADNDESYRGVGAHTDFGSITLLLQDEVDGLQVWEKATQSWLDVEPVPGAYVVNLGNLFMRWSNDKYISNLHRVINRSGKERYSIPAFINGNPDYLCSCLPNCRAAGTEAKYPPITVADAMLNSYRLSYGRAKEFRADNKQPTTSTVEVK